MKKCVLIVNPKSGKDLERDFLFKYQKILNKYDYETIVYFTSRSKHATEIVKNLDDADLLISLGGDGTFNEVVTGNLLRDKRLLLCHIPIGTTNDVGTMFGYGNNPIKNLKLALEGEVKGIDLCTINKKPFVYVAGFGKFMNIPYDTPRESKKKWGHLAYIFEGAKEFANPIKKYDISYTIDGEAYNSDCSFMLVSNANRIAGINNFYKDVKLNDNKFEVIMCSLTKKEDIVRSLYYMTTSKIEEAIGFEFHRVDNITIKFKDKLEEKDAWCIDGEKLEDSRSTFNIEITKDFRILMPSKNIKKLFND